MPSVLPPVVPAVCSPSSSWSAGLVGRHQHPDHTVHSALLRFSKKEKKRILQAESICAGSVPTSAHLVWLPMAQPVKNPPAMQETQVQSLGQEEPLEKEMAPHSSTLAFRILWSRGA